MLDIAATSRRTARPRLEWVRNVLLESLPYPLTVGGGIGNLEDIELVLKAGATRVSMNSAAVKDPDLVGRARRNSAKTR